MEVKFWKYSVEINLFLFYNRIMKPEIFTFCDFAQENNGKLTIVGTFDTIVVRNFPYIHPHISVVVRLRFDLWEIKDHTFRIEMRDLNGGCAIKPVEGKLQTSSGENTTAVSHLVFTIGNIRLFCETVFNFVLFVDDQEISTSPLYINKSKSEGQFIRNMQ
ncbi:MAG: hypothetical protein LBC53_00150 [Spirochaetaceae bacterium]|jgi:hypothetical protein|nr:hypothetical protein [Spirochaetaceae bacterium]